MADLVHPDGFTETDCQNCLAYIHEIYPDAKARLDRLAEAGFPLPQQMADNEANHAGAQGFLRTYAPHRLHGMG